MKSVPAYPSAQVAQSRGLRLRPIRWITTVLVALVAVAALGAVYEAVMAAGDAQRYPAPGKLVDAGGHRLHLYCTGTGSPTVVFEAGKGGTSLDWSLVQLQLETETRVCAYDRAGTGWSEPGPLPRTPEQVVTEFHTMLQTSGEAGPYILVAHSLGGRYVRLFAEQYPDEVVGMVLVDARSEYHDLHMDPALKAEMAARNTPGPEIEPMRRLGLLRLFAVQLFALLNPESTLLPAKTLTTMMVQSTRPTAIGASQSEFIEIERSDALLQTATLGDMPLRVLVSEETTSIAPFWMEGEEDQAARSTNSTLTLLPGGHFLMYGNAGAVVAAVREVLQLAVR
jgi:pimeloyl-ACP methyl ester carboxylesterase